MAVGIFVVISGLLIANFRRARQGDAVRSAAAVLVAHAQRLQASALAGENGGAVAFGLHLTAATDDQYIRFGDQSAGTRGAYDAGEELVSGIVRLPSDVRISAVTPDGVTDVTFTIPRATVRFTGGNTAAELRVRLAHRVTGDARTVVINRISGQVSVE